MERIKILNVELRDVSRKIFDKEDNFLEHRKFQVIVCKTEDLPPVTDELKANMNPLISEINTNEIVFSLEDVYYEVIPENATLEDLSPTGDVAHDSSLDENKAGSGS